MLIIHLSKEQSQDLLDNDDVGYECAFGCINSDASYRVVEVDSDCVLLDREALQSDLYKDLEDIIKTERHMLLSSSSL